MNNILLEVLKFAGIDQQANNLSPDPAAIELLSDTTVFLFATIFAFAACMVIAFCVANNQVKNGDRK